jgi:hypothetical protein
VVEPGRHRRRLRELTGLDVQEGQARRLLNDIANFGAWLQSHEGRALSEQVVAHRWLQQSFEPTVAVVPDELWSRREPAEVFHEILDHWYFLSTCEGKDMELFDAARSYVDNVLTYAPVERTIEGDDAEAVLGDD